MARPVDRRLICTGLSALAVGVAGHASAKEPDGFDGSWGGAQDGVTGQIIVAGATVIGFFWRDDYVDTSDPKLSPDSRSLSFAFQGGAATLTRTGESTARLDVTEGTKVTRLNVQRD
jgi:hypothetical protein